MEMLITYIYKFLWHLVYNIVLLYEFCLWLCLRIISFAFWSYDICRTSEEKEQNEFDFLQQCKKHLNKIPNHLNIIIGPENTQVNDELLTRIFSYAIHMDISCISYYDTRYTNAMVTKSCLTVLEKLKCPKGWKRKDVNKFHSVWYNCKDVVSNGIKRANGATTSIDNNTFKTSLTNGHLQNSPSVSLGYTSLEIYEIQPQNNRPLLAQVCRDLFKLRHTKEIQNLLEERTSLMERINQELSYHLENLTEPDLSIIFDENLCTFGMLPWHTRFTEFHRHPKGLDFNVKTFAHILYKYSRCEQRWGK